MTDSSHRWSHLGLCVSDLARAMRFYCDGLGCEPAERYDLDSRDLPGLAEGLEVPGPVRIVSQMITHGGLRIELLGWESPTPVGAPSTTRHHLGLTHLSFLVDDVDEASSRLETFGGAVIPGTRQSVGLEIVFLTDPDGTRVELMAPPRPPT